jgi:hypothetical protein
VTELIGKTLVRVEATDDAMAFWCSDGSEYSLHHEQDCCENVTIESIVGDPLDLVDTPILMAEEVTGHTPVDYQFEYEPESYTWTFYKFATIRGYVDVRFLGISNGYYGESADFYRIKEPTEVAS